MSNLNFLARFKMTCNRNGVSAGAAMWFCYFYIRKPDPSIANGRIGLHNSSNKSLETALYSYRNVETLSTANVFQRWRHCWRTTWYYQWYSNDQCAVHFVCPNTLSQVALLQDCIWRSGVKRHLHRRITRVDPLVYAASLGSRPADVNERALPTGCLSSLTSAGMNRPLTARMRKCTFDPNRRRSWEGSGRPSFNVKLLSLESANAVLTWSIANSELSTFPILEKSSILESWPYCSVCLQPIQVPSACPFIIYPATFAHIWSKGAKRMVSLQTDSRHRPPNNLYRSPNSHSCSANRSPRRIRLRRFSQRDWNQSICLLNDRATIVQSETACLPLIMRQSLTYRKKLESKDLKRVSHILETHATFLDYLSYTTGSSNSSLLDIVTVQTRVTCRYSQLYSV